MTASGLPDRIAKRDAIARQIHIVRGERVMLDEDLAALYGVPTKRLNEAVRRNLRRFPDDFMFRLNKEEAARLKSRSATSNVGGADAAALPRAPSQRRALR